MSSHLQSTAFDQSGQTRFYNFGIRQSQEFEFSDSPVETRMGFQGLSVFRVLDAEGLLDSAEPMTDYVHSLIGATCTC